MSNKLRKVGIVGVGHVGAHCAFSLVTQGIVDELVLVDTNKQKAVSERQDLIDSVAYLPHRVNIKAGEYEDLKDCDIVVISVGTITKDHNRLSELQNSIDIVNSFVKKIVDGGFDGIFINITNPCDIIARRVWQLSGFDKSRVLATGTGLDSSRFKAILARETGVDHKSIQGHMLGEHGDSQLAAWSQVSFSGKPLSELEKEDPETFGHLDKPAIEEEVRKAGWVTFSGKGATEFGIASTLARLVNCIFHDEKQVMPASTLLEGQYGEEGIFISTLCMIGKGGVEKAFEMKLNDEELDAFKHSCDVIRGNISKIK
ncbi:MAG: L-lactate dehydrogenase [Clostridium sp.]|nr:L-lactate dehydrogenase [Clostridium sp.]